MTGSGWGGEGEEDGLGLGGMSPMLNQDGCFE
jgi:hypothetical protein